MDAPLEAFEQQRPLMFSIAYRMLGTVSDAEDILQEAYLRWQQAEHDEIRSPGSFLSATVSRLCIDHLRSARVRREQYVGPWLPEPLIGESRSAPADDAELAESLSMAFLMMLEKLSPTERAVLLLHDVFGFDFEEVAQQVGKTAVNCRQICSRARGRLERTEARRAPNPVQAEQLAVEFLAACRDGDVGQLMAMMADDVTLYSDGGGKVAAALRPIEGATNVARFLVGIAKKASADIEARPVVVNGGPGLAVLHHGAAVRVFALEFDGPTLRTICVVGNPDKLRHLQQ